MERLTKRLDDGQAVMDCESCELREQNCGPLACRNRLRYHLAAYEDTGLKPEEINELLLKVATLETIESIYDGLGHPDHLRELVQAEQDGRLVVLPCRVGDTVWYITSTMEICEAEVTGILLNAYTNPKMWLEIKYYSRSIGEHEYKSRVDLMLGKTVFLTREEAEAALKGGAE